VTSPSTKSICCLAFSALLAAGCGETVRLPADFQCGVNYAHIHRRGHGYGSEASAAELSELKGIGVNWIAITPFGYQPGATADTIIFSGDRSLKDDDLAREIAAAHKLSIRVTLKPHIWSRDFWDGKEWNGSVRQDSPEAHARWWTCYREFALHYAEVAERVGADQYCIGTELVGMTTQHPGEWHALIADVRKVYRGPLTYAAHFDREFDGIPFWDALDFIGITAYFPLDLPEGASVEQLVAAWKPHRQRIEKLQAQFGKPVLFMEIGYRAVADAYQKPWTYDGGKPDPDAQARAYEAVFRAFVGAPWWKGTYFWKAFTDPKLADARGDGVDFSFRGLPAEVIIRKWYAGDSRAGE
jgi:hypothetical protein